MQLLPWVISSVANQINQRNLDTVDCLREEIRILKSRQKKRIVYTDEERARLATKAKKLGKTGCDFFTSEVLTLKGLATYHVLFFVNIATRQVVPSGITDHKCGQWCEQTAREMTGFDGSIEGQDKKQYLIHDRDSCFTEKFDEIFTSAKIEAIKLPARSPNLNAYAERFVRSIKEQCLRKLILVGPSSLERAVSNYIEFHQTERCHQGIGNVIPFPDKRVKQLQSGQGRITKTSRLGGMLNFYYRNAA